MVQTFILFLSCKILYWQLKLLYFYRIRYLIMFENRRQDQVFFILSEIGYLLQYRLHSLQPWVVISELWISICGLKLPGQTFNTPITSLLIRIIIKLRIAIRITGIYKNFMVTILLKKKKGALVILLAFDLWVCHVICKELFSKDLRGFLSFRNWVFVEELVFVKLVI